MTLITSPTPQPHRQLPRNPQSPSPLTSSIDVLTTGFPVARYSLIFSGDIVSVNLFIRYGKKQALQPLTIAGNSLYGIFPVK